MATGIPNSGNSANGTTSGGGVVLSYPGKKAVEEILATQPAAYARVRQSETPTDNTLYFGENLSILAALLRDPNVCGKVRLVYIDPPYATRSVFQSRKQVNAYSDTLAGAAYLEFLRERLVLLRELLADNGSIYVHLDENMAFHAKVLMDEVFGQSNFRNWITRKKCNPKNYTRKTYGNVADYILFYTKTDDYVWHRPVEAWSLERAEREYSHVEPQNGRRFKKVPVHAPGTRNGETGKPWRGRLPPPGKHWQYPPSRLDEMDARGEIYWSPTGNPRRRVYLDQSEGIPVQDIWMEFRDAHNQNIHITGYPTEKNPALLERMIDASSEPGDIVVDCFSGSGTTLEVAHRMGRRWIGIDNSAEAIRTTLERFETGVAPMGDFVQPEKRAKRISHDRVGDIVLPWLSVDDPHEIEMSVNGDHTPIRDFSLCVEEGLPTEDFFLPLPRPQCKRA